MSNFAIRTVSKQESHSLAIIFANSFFKKPVDSKYLERLTRIFRLEISRKIVNFLVAEKDSHIVGMGGEIQHLGSSYIGYLGVIPSFRKHGIGSKLFQGLLEQSLDHNQTVELFSNLGVEDLYRKFNFVDDFYTHVYNLTEHDKNIDPYVKSKKKSIPKWLLELDRQAMGFDRSNFLKFLIKDRKGSIAHLGNKSYAFLIDGTIGPLIAENVEDAKSLINFFVSKGAVRIITSIEENEVLKSFSPKKIHTCLKMRYGKSLKGRPLWIWAYHSFATS